MQLQLTKSPFWAAAISAAMLLPASALNIVLTNDDGFETANIQALHKALKAAGHDVILSAPFVNQSGTSGMVAFLTPITPTKTASQGGLLPAGSPGVGPTTLAEAQYYVAGSPVAAVLYGIDVLAPQRWGCAPDLVISGPNEGNNVGLLTTHSGTVGAAMTAINKGIPAVAVSGFTSFAATTPAEAEVNAALTVKLIDALDEGRCALLPLGTGLNVNLPQLEAGKTADAYRFRQTQVGTAADFGLRFYSKLEDSTLASQFLPAQVLSFPGVSLETPFTAAGYPADESVCSEFNSLKQGNVTISVIEGTCQADRVREAFVRSKLNQVTRPNGSAAAGKHK